jgi:parvulin-like peptidyl-prolyl isomerase
MRYLKALLLVLVTAGTVCAAGAGSSPVIELGATVVTRAQVEQRFQVAVRVLALRQGIALAAQDASVIEQLRVQYLDKYATEMVMLEEAARRQLAISDAVVDAELAALFTDDAAKCSLLADTGIDATVRDEQLHDLIRNEKLVELLTEHMLKETRIPPGDVITLHHDIKHALATPEEACVRHVQSATVEAANEILARIEGGEDMAVLAKSSSTDAASAALGGDLGCFERKVSATNTAFEKAVFTAREGELIGPVESQFGYHVLVVYERKEAREPTLNEAYMQIERELAMEQLPQRIKTLIDSSGVRTYPENFINATE